MFSILKKLLRSEVGWMAAIPMLMQMGSSIASNIQGQAAAKRARRKTGEETNLQQGFIGDTGPGSFTPLNEQQAGQQDFLNQTRDAAMGGGLMPAIGEAFSQRPNSSEFDAIARQEQNLKNQALNTGARGGLLKQQMFEASKNAATNKLNVMENARQNALQRAFQTFLPTAPNQASSNAINSQIGSGLTNLATMGIQRNGVGLGAAQQDQSAGGAGLGQGLGSILGMLGSSGGGGAVSNAVGGTPTFSLPMAGQGFSNIFASGY